MAFKTKDFTVVRGTEKLEYRRAVQINGKTSNLTVMLSQNNKKGIFHLEFKMNSEHITGEKTDDKATLKAFNEIAIHAINDGMKWKKDWNEANKEKEDENQTEMFEGENSNDLEYGFE